MADKINDQAFGYVSAATDNTKAEIFKKKDSLTKEEISNTLELIGAIPGIGEPADALNALLLGSEGDYKGAALSIASMVPIIGGTKNAKKLLELAKEVRMRKAEKLANEMVDKGHMWNKHFDRPGSLLKPLKGKYKEIPKLREEIDMIDLELEKDYYLRTIGRIPNLPKFKKGK